MPHTATHFPVARAGAAAGAPTAGPPPPPQPPLDFEDVFDIGIGDLVPSDFGPLFPTGPKQEISGAPRQERFAPQAGLAPGLLAQTAQRALGGGQRNFDRAANRLRDRLAVESRGLQSQALQRNLPSGFTGQTRGALDQLERARLGAFSEGLVGLERDFEQSAVQRLGAATQAAGALGNIDIGRQALGQRDIAERRGLNQDVFEFVNRLTEEGRQFDIGLGSEQQGLLLQLLNQLRLGKAGIGVDLANILKDI